MPVLIVFTGVVVLLLLINLAKINAFISFVIVSLFVGLCMGLSLNDTAEALKRGILAVQRIRRPFCEGDSCYLDRNGNHHFSAWYIGCAYT